MRNRIRDIFTALVLTALVFSMGCGTLQQEPPGTGTGTPEQRPSPPEVAGPSKCDVDGINEWIASRIKSIGGPLKEQYEGQKFTFNAEEFSVTTPNPNGGEQVGKFKRLIISKKLTDHYPNANTNPGQARTLPQLNGIIQPLINWGSGSKGPCIVEVKYVTEATKDAAASDDFMWSYCPVGSQVCSNGTCDVYCTGGTRSY